MKKCAIINTIKFFLGGKNHEKKQQRQGSRNDF